MARAKYGSSSSSLQYTKNRLTASVVYMDFLSQQCAVYSCCKDDRKKRAESKNETYIAYLDLFLSWINLTVEYIRTAVRP